MDKCNKTKPLRVSEDFYDLAIAVNSNDQRKQGRKVSMGSSIETRFKDLLKSELKDNNNK